MGIANMFLFAGMLTSVDPALISAICYVESKHRQDAYVHHDGGSPSIGICQVKLATARMLGFKGTAKALQEPFTNALYAAKYLKKQLRRYRNDTRKAISAYNAGKSINSNHAYVNAVLKARGPKWKSVQLVHAVNNRLCTRSPLFRITTVLPAR